MNTISSRDGTRIAYERIGDGPPVILVGGAFGHRSQPELVKLAWLMASRFTVVTYDRRGRGESSGDAPPYAVEREIEDLAALVDAAGGSAFVWGMSSGGVLALRAAASGARIDRLALYEPPFALEGSGHLPPADFQPRPRVGVVADRSQAFRFFRAEGLGAPAAVVAALRLVPRRTRLGAIACTLPYDDVVGRSGSPLARGEWASVIARTLVLAGPKAAARTRRAGEALAAVLPDARYRRLAGRARALSAKALAPVLHEFFTGAGDLPPAPPWALGRPFGEDAREAELERAHDGA